MPITRSEWLFKRHCTRRSVSCRRIPPSDKRAADYWVTVDGIRFAAEVKQLDVSKDDRRLGALFDAGDQRPVMGSRAAKRIQAMIDSGYPQLKGTTQGAAPGILVVYNNTPHWWNLLDSFAISSAMFGHFFVGIEFDASRVIRHTGQGYRGQTRTNVKQCRSLSAILVLSGRTEKSTRIEAYHNPFATHPIAPALIAVIADMQYRHPAPHTWGATSWHPEEFP